MRQLRDWQARKAWLARAQQPARRPTTPFNSSTGANMLVLVNQDDTAALNATRAFAKTQRDAGATLQQLAFTRAKLPPDQLCEQLWSPATLSFAGLPKRAAEQFWRKQEFDLVIHASLRAFAPFDYLVAGLAAHRRIAAYDTALAAYDLVITPPADKGIADYFQQVVRYLAILSD